MYVQISKYTIAYNNKIISLILFKDIAQVIVPSGLSISILICRSCLQQKCDIHETFPTVCKQVQNIQLKQNYEICSKVCPLCTFFATNFLLFTYIDRTPRIDNIL